MFGLVMKKGMTLSGHLSNINEMLITGILKIFKFSNKVEGTKKNKNKAVLSIFTDF
jgi:hypothetical protein